MKRLLCLSTLLAVLPLCAQAQSGAEMTTREEAASFKAKVNLVTVPVVVRDIKGNAIGNLTKDSFRLFDKGKPQEITRFSVERTGTAASAETGPTTSAEDGSGAKVVAPDRFVALVFDDLHLPPDLLGRVRDAAARFIDGIRPADRLAIYGLSGEVNQDFTDDRARLHAAVARVRNSQMVNLGGLNSSIQQVLTALGNMQAIAKRLGFSPGERTMIFISPGFNTIDPLYHDAISSIIEQAIRSKVIISSLDARGLYTARAFSSGSTTAAFMRGSLMNELASGTGGTFFENNNSFDEGFRRVAAAPEYVYMLAFAPQNLKSDGSFHTLRVALKDGSGLVVNARHGYYAPKRSDDIAETARQEIEAALFSREELSELPVQLHTQFFKSDANAAKLTVIATLNLKQFKYRKAQERNCNEVTVVSGIFDRNGTYIKGVKKVVDLKLKDTTMARLGDAVPLRTTFDLAPGTYLVRLVVRDSEGQALSAANNAVEIQ